MHTKEVPDIPSPGRSRRPGSFETTAALPKFKFAGHPTLVPAPHIYGSGIAAEIRRGQCGVIRPVSLDASRFD
jgi:hypothetical protein